MLIIFRIWLWNLALTILATHDGHTLTSKRAPPCHKHHRFTSGRPYVSEIPPQTASGAIITPFKFHPLDTALTIRFHDRSPLLLVTRASFCIYAARSNATYRRAIRNNHENLVCKTVGMVLKSFPDKFVCDWMGRKGVFWAWDCVSEAGLM